MEVWLNYILSNWQAILVGGAVIVGVVVFLMGLFKKFIGNRIHNKMLRKTVLSFLSLAIVPPITALYTFYNGWAWDMYWLNCVLYAVSTIVVYWFYEGTHLREMLGLIGAVTVGKVWASLKKNPMDIDALKELAPAINENAKQEMKKKYNEDDLNNL